MQELRKNREIQLNQQTIRFGAVSYLLSSTYVNSASSHFPLIPTTFLVKAKKARLIPSLTNQFCNFLQEPKSDVIKSAITNSGDQIASKLDKIVDFLQVSNQKVSHNFIYNLFVTSKNETTNSPILQFKVLKKGQRVF